MYEFNLVARLLDTLRHKQSTIMKRIRFSSHQLWPSVVAFVALTLPAAASPQTTTVQLKTIIGKAEYSTPSGDWQPLRLDSKLVGGSVIRTLDSGKVDFYMRESKTTLRLIPNSRLAVESLKVWRTGEQNVTDTKLRLLAGGIVGAQEKLARPSRFQIETPQGMATIVGTEYVVRADGAVTVLDGSVSVTYNLPGNQGSVKVTVAAGQSFDPATGMVVPTTPEYLDNIIADINTVKQNAQVFKTGDATVVVKAEKEMSPTAP